MISSLNSLSLNVIVNNIQGNITQQIENINYLNVDSNSKKAITEYLEKSQISAFIDNKQKSKGLVVESYINCNYTEKIKILLKYYPEHVDIYNTEYFGQTPLYNACNFCNYKMVELLLQNGADSNAQEFENSETPLMSSAYQNDVTITSLLLQYGADCNLQNSFNETALHIACWRGHLNIVKLLLQYEANPFIESSFSLNNTPLKLATDKGFTKIAEILTKYEAYQDYEDDKNE
jgi:ankyrin repeat protein